VSTYLRTAIHRGSGYDARSGLIYATTGDNYSDPPSDTSDAILAFNAASGQLAWSHQVLSGDAYTIACSVAPPGPNCPAANGPDLDFGSSAILVDLPHGKRALIGGQKTGGVTAVDPDHSGEVLWQKRVGKGGKLGGVQWGSAADDDKIFVAVSDVQFTAVSPDTPGAQPSPFNRSVGWLVNNTTGGGLHALKLETGQEVWQTPHPGCNNVPGCSPAQSAAVTAIPGVVFSGSFDGHLRAYAADDGHIVWDWTRKASITPSMALRRTAARSTEPGRWSLVACFMWIRVPAYGAGCLATCFWRIRWMDAETKSAARQIPCCSRTDCCEPQCFVQDFQTEAVVCSLS